MRQSSTIKQNCPFEVKIVLCQGKYKVKSAKTTHENHNVDRQTYLHYPENMRLNSEEQLVVIEMIKCGGKKQKIKNVLMEKRNEEPLPRPLPLKSIHNVGTKMHHDIHQLITEETELQKLLEKMQQIPNVRIRVAVDDNDELLGISFQDERMARLFDKYPELLLIDATYKLNNRRIPLFTLLIVDGNGQSEIACLWFIKSESKECLSPMIDAFQDLNPNWTKTRVIISDKDLAERTVFSDKFLGIPLQICLFHALRSFNREITPAKREITVQQREQVLEILSKMAYSRSSAEYDILYAELVNLNFTLVTKYFDENWHGIKDEWTLHGKNEWSNYMNYTNNRLESLNQKLKIIGTHYASLLNFFENIVQSYKVLSSEKDIKVVQQSMKVVRVRFDDITLKRFNDLLTPYVSQKIAHEYERMETVSFTVRLEDGAVMKYGELHEIFVKIDSCSCGFFKTMNLPCRHVFQFRKEEGLDMFEPNLCAQRWFKSYYYSSHPALNFITPLNNVPISYIRAKVPGEIDKFKSASKITKDINALMSTLPTGQYNSFMDRLTNIRGEISINEVGPSPRQLYDSENTATFDVAHEVPLDLSCSNYNQQLSPNSALNLMSVSVDSIIESPALSPISKNVTASQPTNTNFTIPQGYPSTHENSNLTEIRKIKLPSQNYRVGRPKGSGRTVVGTKKKSITNREQAISTGRVTRSKSQKRPINEKHIQEKVVKK